MFKDVTGEAIGAYIRARRLSRAAIALRLTARPILDIALQYRFDSQQTFTRAFKKQFNKTPALYRRLDEWCSDGICSAILLDDVPMPEHEFVTLPPRTVTGIENSCSHRLEDWATACTHMRRSSGCIIFLWRKLSRTMFTGFTALPVIRTKKMSRQSITPLPWRRNLLPLPLRKMFTRWKCPWRISLLHLQRHSLPRCDAGIPVHDLRPVCAATGDHPPPWLRY